MRQSFVLCFLISACAARPASPPSPPRARNVVTPLASVHFEPTAPILRQLHRFDRIAKRHTRAVRSFEQDTSDLAAPTSSVECEMLRLQCATATMNVIIVNGSAVSAAAYVGLHVNEISLGQRSDSVRSSLDTYEKSVDTLLDRMAYARDLFKTFATCRKDPPSSLLPATPATL